MAKPGGWLERLRAGLARTRAGLAERVEGLLGGGRIDDSVYEGLEEALIQADMGVATTMRIMDGLRERVRRESPRDAAAVKELLREEILAVLELVAKPLTLSPAGLNEMLIVGDDGAVKTNSVGKPAYQFLHHIGR